ncbi:MAG: hypothetical protein K9M36_02970 [Candidatus Pacebacteria bacterium]|nr:hypothetical protein [Candidatus Paceibacterota bacterium]
MKQTQSKINIKKTQTLTIQKVYASLTLFGLLLISCVWYMVSLYGAISSVAQKRTYDERLQHSLSRVASLELEYYSQSQSLTLTHAFSLGYQSSLKSSFIQRNTLALNVNPSEL